MVHLASIKRVNISRYHGNYRNYFSCFIISICPALAPTTVAEYNERVMQLERSFLLPAGYPRHPHQRHLVYGPDNEDDSRGALFPHLVVAIRQARKRPTSPALSYVRENLSLVLHALRSASGVLDRSLLRVPEGTTSPRSTS